MVVVGARHRFRLETEQYIRSCRVGDGGWVRSSKQKRLARGGVSRAIEEGAKKGGVVGKGKKVFLQLRFYAHQLFCTARLNKLMTHLLDEFRRSSILLLEIVVVFFVFDVG